MAMAMAVQFSGIRCGKENSNVSISNAETKERLKLKQVFHEANKRCLSSPMDGVSFTIDDFHAALDFHSRSPLETKSMYPISKTDSESELRIGCVVSGSVESVKAYGAFVKIGGMNMNGLLHHTQISHHHFSDIANVVQPGDTLKVMILSHDLKRRRISLSTKHLEPTPGDMIHNPNLVFEKADEMAHTFSQRIAQAQAMAHAHLLRFQPEESGLNRSFGGISASLTSELPPEVVVTDAPSTE